MAVLDAQDGLTVVAEAGDGYSAVHLLAQDDPQVDLVLLDLRMPGIDGVEVTRRIRAAHRPDQVRILVLTTFDQDENVLAALRAGADGFLSKGAGSAELADGIRQVAGGGHALSPSAVGALVEHVAEDQAAPPDPTVAARFVHLTPREREMVEAIVRGMDYAQVAAELYLSPLTVKTHVNRAMTKVGARDRAHLVSLAVLAGMRP